MFIFFRVLEVDFLFELNKNIIFFEKIFAKAKICSTFAFAIGLWCNGNTTDSGPVILGSSPGSPTVETLLWSVFFCCKPGTDAGLRSDEAYGFHALFFPVFLLSLEMALSDGIEDFFAIHKSFLNFVFR